MKFVQRLFIFLTLWHSITLQFYPQYQQQYGNYGQYPQMPYQQQQQIYYPPNMNQMAPQFPPQPQPFFPQNMQMPNMPQGFNFEEARPIERKLRQKVQKKKIHKKKNIKKHLKKHKKTKQHKKERKLELTLNDNQANKDQERKTTLDLDRRRRALLWIFKNFISILKVDHVQNMDQVKNHFQSFFKNDDPFFENQFIQIFQSHLQSNQLDYHSIENELVVKIMNLEINNNIQIIDNALKSNFDEQPTGQKNQQGIITQEFYQNLDLLRKIVSGTEKILQTPDQEKFILVSMNDNSIKTDADLQNKKILTVSFLNNFIKYYKGLDYTKKNVEADLKIKEAQELISQLDQQKYGYFYLKFLEVSDDWNIDFKNMTEKSREQLNEQILKLKSELHEDFYLETIYKILTKYPKLGQRKYDDKNYLITYQVFMQVLENLIPNPKMKFLIENYFYNFFDQFQELNKLVFDSDPDSLLKFDYAKFLTFLSTQATYLEFLNLNKIFTDVYQQSFKSFANQYLIQHKKKLNEVLEVYVNLYFKLFYPYIEILNSQKFTIIQNRYNISKEVLPRTIHQYKQNDIIDIKNQYKYLEQQDDLEKAIDEFSNQLDNLKSQKDIDQFRNSEEFNKIQNVLKQTYGQDFIEKEINKRSNKVNNNVQHIHHSITITKKKKPSQTEDEQINNQIVDEQITQKNNQIVDEQISQENNQIVNEQTSNKQTQTIKQQSIDEQTFSEDESINKKQLIEENTNQLRNKKQIQTQEIQTQTDDTHETELSEEEKGIIIAKFILEIFKNNNKVQINEITNIFNNFIENHTISSEQNLHLTELFNKLTNIKQAFKTVFDNRLENFFIDIWKILMVYYGDLENIRLFIKLRQILIQRKQSNELLTISQLEIFIYNFLQVIVRYREKQIGESIDNFTSMINQKKRIQIREINKHLIKRKDISKTKLNKIQKIPNVPPSSTSKQSVQENLPPKKIKPPKSTISEHDSISKEKSVKRNKNFLNFITTTNKKRLDFSHKKFEYKSKSNRKEQPETPPNEPPVSSEEKPSRSREKKITSSHPSSHQSSHPSSHESTNPPTESEEVKVQDKPRNKNFLNFLSGFNNKVNMFSKKIYETKRGPGKRTGIEPPEFPSTKSLSTRSKSEDKPSSSEEEIKKPQDRPQNKNFLNFLTGDRNKLQNISKYTYIPKSGPGNREEYNPPQTSESYSHEEPTEEKVKNFTSQVIQTYFKQNKAAQADFGHYDPYSKKTIYKVNLTPDKLSSFKNIYKKYGDFSSFYHSNKRQKVFDLVKKILYKSDKPEQYIKRIPPTEPPSINKKITHSEKTYYQKVLKDFHESQTSSLPKNTEFSKIIMYKPKNLKKHDYEYLHKLYTSYPNITDLQKRLRESEPMADKLKKILYKTVHKRMCKRKKNPEAKKDCHKKCFKIIGTEKIEIKEDDPLFHNLCEEFEKENKEEKQTGQDEYEEFECDEFGNDISPLGRNRKKKQINLSPKFNLNFVFKNDEQLEEFKKFAQTSDFLRMVEPLDKDNVVDIKQLEAKVEKSDNKIFNIQFNPEFESQDLQLNKELQKEVDQNVSNRLLVGQMNDELRYDPNRVNKVVNDIKFI